MDSRAAPGRLRDDRGLASLQFVVAAGLAMVLVVGLVQLVTYQYALGAVMAALERGARTASLPSADEQRCHLVVADSLRSVLGGEVGDSLRYGCEASETVLWAWATGTVPSGMAGAPDMHFALETLVRREVEG